MTQRTGLVPSSTTVAAIAVLAFTVGWTPLAEADITRIVIARVESPTFEGVSFGAVGQYEKLVGRAFGEVDPHDPRNAVIVDIALAPRNARGMVEYSTDIYILRPVDPARGNHRLFFEVNNRGNVLSFGRMNDAGTGGNDPTTAADAGNGFLMRQGYTVVSSGWDVTVAPGGGRQTITVPVAKNPDGSSIVGPALEEFAFDNATTMTGSLTYPTATLDKSQASLTVRVHYTDTPDPIPATGWEYASDRTIRLLPSGTPFGQSRLYEFTYPAKDPSVAGLGFAAIRDVAAFLHRAAVDGEGNPNPLAGDLHFVYSFCNSQPCRFMHDFLQLGFNEDEHGQRVFDGMLNWVGGASGGFFNYRFAQPARTHWQHTGRWYPERQFPFTNKILFDPITGKTDGRLRRCRSTNTCPKIFETGSENEYLDQGRITSAHRHPRERPGRSEERSDVPALEPAACRDERAWYLPAAEEPAGPQSRLARAPAGAGRVGLRGQDATSEPCAAALRRHAGSFAVAETGGVPPHPGGHLQRSHDHGRPVRLRAVV